VIYYTYSPLEEIDMRCKMLATTDIIRDVGYIYYVLGYPKLQDSPLLKSFLEKLKKDFSRVLNADMRKLAGAEGSIAELRANSYHVEVDKDGKPTKIIIDQSPWYRIEHYIKQKEGHYYVLDDSPDSISALSSPDEHLIEWYQWFEDEKGLQDNAYSGKTKIYIHDKDGKLIEKYPFALGPKYTPLREKIHNKYWFERKAFWVEKGQGWDTREEDRIDRRWDLEQIFRKAIMEWEGDVPPPAYFKKALEWGFMNLEMSFRKRFVPHPDDPSKYILREDLDFSGGSLNDRLKDEKGESEKVKEWIDLFPDKKDDITTIETLNTLSRLIERESHPTDKLILLDFWDICQNDTEPRSDAEIARQLKTQRVHLSPQRIGQRRKRLMRTLQEIFCK